MHKITHFFRASKTPEADLHEFEFFAEKVILELNAQHHFFRASKNANSVFSATKQIKKCEATDAQKLLSQSEKVAKCNLRAKLKHMKNVSF